MKKGLFLLMVSLLLQCPVVLSAVTLGNTSSGNTNEALDSNTKGNVFTASQGFTATQMHLYIYSFLPFVPPPPPPAAGWACAIYAVDVSDNPTTLLSDSAYIMEQDGWLTFTLNSAVSINAGQNYFLCFDTLGPSNAGLSSDVPGTRWYSTSTTAFPGTFSNPIAGANNTLSIYASGAAFTDTPTPTFTTTPTATETPTITLTATPSATATATPTATETATITLTATPSATVTITPTVTTTSTITATATYSDTGTVTATTTITFRATSNVIDQALIVGKAAIAYPNPAKDKVTIVLRDGLTGSIRINIFNMRGEQVCQLSTENENKLEWLTAEVGPGIYLYQVVVNNNIKGTYKLTIVK